MTKIWTDFKEWQMRLHRSRNSRWERARTKGKAYFVFKFALKWTSLLSAAPVVTALAFDRNDAFRNWPLTLGMNVLGGILMGLLVWWSNEAECTNARIDARLKGQED
jgi:hypothetical protein